MIDSQSKLSEYLQQDLLRLLSLTAICGLLGWAVGFPWSAMIVGVVLFLAGQMRALYQLYRWLRFAPQEEPPQLAGVWSALIYNIQRIQVKEQRAQEGLRSVLERARVSVSALEEAVVLIDGNDLLEWWNAAAQQLLGLQAGDQGRNVCNLIRTPEFLKYFHQPSYGEGTKLQSWVKPGRYLQCKLTRFGENSRLMLVHDVTRLHNLEQIRKDFVANVSHELKTPLTVLSGYLETFSDHPDLNPRWQAGFAQMRQQSKRMDLLINDLLHLSRLESDGFVTDKQIIDMPTFLNQIKQDAEGYNQDFAHEITLTIDSKKNLRGNPKELASAFMNLVTNAMKYTPKNGKIMLSWRDDGKQAYFVVADSGIGIDSRHIPRLTERFYRVDRGRSLETGGTGLGLAIVKHVLAQHEARLDIASVPNKGSTFSCVFAWSEVV